MLNTRLWRHRTEIPPSDGTFSVSIAKDIFFDAAMRAVVQSDMTNIDGLIASRDMQANEVVVRSDEDPNIVIEQSVDESKCNCEMVEVVMEEQEAENADHEQVFAIITTKFVRKGEWFCAHVEE